MRLIDADELINQGYEIVVDGWQYDTCNKSIDIDDIPTAYDIDKVVAELESFVKLAEDRWVNGTSKYAYQECKCWVKAIEIVKQGGASDDVCEWEKGSSGYVGYPAYYSKCCTTNSNGLEMQTHIISDWKYCPYCGKKIKIVGD